MYFQVILPNLQTDYTLPVSAMPEFNFSTPVAQQKASTNSSSVGQLPAVSSSPVKPSVNFTFSSPIHEDVPVNKPASPQKYSVCIFYKIFTVFDALCFIV